MSDNQSITCFCCGVCCSRHRVRITQEEAERIAVTMGMSCVEFLGKYAEPWFSNYLLLQKNDSCIFLKRENDHEAYCTIHRFKPMDCLGVAASLAYKDCIDGLAKCWGLLVEADGEIKGEKARFKEFWSFVETLEK
jgi:Fe-S-cluster containining protein